MNAPAPAELRKAMSRFATGVAVITARDDGGPQGMTVNSLTSVSLDPPLLLVCLDPGTRTAGALLGAGRFAVNVLGARQQGVSGIFARRGEDHFAGVELPAHASGVPLIPNALAHAVCTVDRAVQAGDHVVVFGLVTDLAFRDGAPLVFFGGGYGDFADRGEPAEFWFG